MSDGEEKNKIRIEHSIAAGDYLKAGGASNDIKETLKMIGIPPNITRRAAIIAYEAEMNLVIHGGGGNIAANIDDKQIEIVTTDHGPGIPDVALALQEGYTTANDNARSMGFGAGMGLPNIKRNSDVFNIDSEVGKGTTLKAAIDITK
ncbi:anti-sigma regulatory factor [Synergistales bacterium]|nr:anti-sigma regulatory factor [Synergistales bacterium]GHV51001.1 anti-sigma regulatory factor [Synergistales bacterium]